MDALCVGYCTLDQIGLVEHFARDDEEVEMPTFSVQGGGTAATAAVALARWGTSTGFVGKVGDDDRGSHIVRTLADEGVDTSQVVRQDHKISQVRFVVVDTSSGQRHAYYTPGNVGTLRSDEIDSGLLDDCRLLVVDGNYPQAQIELMERAQSGDVTVVMHLPGNPDSMEECVGHADVVVASERTASAFTGVGSLRGICEAFLEYGPRIAIVTLGDEGAVASSRSAELVRVSAPQVEVVDSTGADDVFVGGVALGVLEQWDLEKIVRYANSASRLACTGPGGRSAIADRTTLEDELGG